MISRETFKKAINFIIQADNFYSELDGLYRKFDDTFFDGASPILNTSPIVEVLNESLGLEVDEDYGSDLDYWLYECDYGKEWNDRDVENTFLPEDDKYRKPKIDNLDDLYDYLTYMGSYYTVLRIREQNMEEK